MAQVYSFICDIITLLILSQVQVFAGSFYITMLLLLRLILFLIN